MELAIHSGHNISIAVLLDDCRIIAVADRGDSLNLHCYKPAVVRIRLKQLIDRLSSAITETSETLLRRCKHLVLSLPGASASHDQEKARRCAKDVGCQVAEDTLFIADDTWTGLVAGTLESRGVCAYAGTGASLYIGLCHHFSRGKPYKFDGWGPILGDRGSKFHLGLLTLNHLAFYFDSHNEPSPIQTYLIPVDNAFERPNELQAWFDSLLSKDHFTWRLRIARLADTVVTLAERNDNTPVSQRAADLVNECAAGMGRTIASSLHVYPDAVRLPAVWQGGMFQNSAMFRAGVNNSIQSLGVELSRPKFFPIVGAMLLGVSRTGTVSFGTKVDNLLDSVDHQSHDVRKRMVMPTI